MPNSGDSAPNSWADFYLHYKNYISFRLYRVGFAAQDVEDETMTIIARLIERNYLAIYDPSKQVGGRTTKFRTMLTETVRLTCWGVGERLRRHAYREPLLHSFALPGEGEDEVASALRVQYSQPNRNLTDSSVEGFLFDPARRTVSLIRTRLLCEEPELLPLFLALEDDCGASELSLARRLQQSKNQVHDDLAALREFAAGVAALDSYQAAA